MSLPFDSNVDKLCILADPCGSCGSHAVCEYDVFGKANCKCPLIGDKSDPSKKCSKFTVYMV